MDPKMPKKPTTPFGYISFSKDGKVTPHIDQLPTYKAGQESQAAQRFSEQLEKYYGIKVKGLSLLEEKDHDATFTIGGKKIVLQITEISEREFILPSGSPDPNNAKSIAFFSVVNTVGVQIDSEKKNRTIQLAMERKLAKNYSAENSASLWLLIFTTSPYIGTEFFRDGILVIDEPLQRARSFATAHSIAPFSEIWFTNFELRPIRVWPLGEP